MNNINYTFIVPHKNCPQLLNRCIDSIPVREDIQIIVVDDNSDDDKKPSIIRAGVETVLLNKADSNGAGKARNVGLEKAKGKWLLFADADDYYSDNLNILLDKYANDETTDLVYLNACVFDEQGVKTKYKTDKLIIDYLNGRKNSEMRLRYSLWTPWSRMVKRLLVVNNEITFDELPAGNDIMFGLKSSRYSKIIQTESNVIYNYYKPISGSITDHAREKMVDSRLILRGNIIEFYRKVGYKSNYNFLSLIISYNKNEGSTLSDTIRKYKDYLAKYNTSLLSDFTRYIKSKIHNFFIQLK